MANPCVVTGRPWNLKCDRPSVSKCHLPEISWPWWAMIVIPTMKILSWPFQNYGMLWALAASYQHEVLQEPLRGPQHRNNENCFRTNLRVVPPLVTCAPMGPSLKLFIIRPSEFSERSCLKVVGIYEEYQFKLKWALARQFTIYAMPTAFLLHTFAPTTTQPRRGQSLPNGCPHFCWQTEPAWCLADHIPVYCCLGYP
jgi:hypothetical protein